MLFLAMQLIPALAKLLVFKLARFFAATDVYSSAHTGMTIAGNSIDQVYWHASDAELNPLFLFYFFDRTEAAVF